jgi:hypothetical protein
MKIDRSNYEIWLIDWLDGNLSQTEAEELWLFLKKNPDLKGEVEELSEVKLISLSESYPHKNQLKKTSADLAGTQIEYLSAAYLEGDLTSNQKSELKEIVESDPKKNSVFELMQRMKLVPVAVTYKHKKRLTRRTFAQKAVRFTVVGLPAAAMIALAIVSYNSGPRTVKQVIIAKTGTEGSTDVKPSEAGSSKITQAEGRREKPVIRNKNLSFVSAKTAFISQGPERIDQTESDTNLTINNTLPAIPEKTFFPRKINISTMSLPNILVALSSTPIIPEIDDGRSRLSKFIAKNFREKILKENRAQDSPLKAYEIAEAGVSGLNKLLGWEMALDKRNDGNGELRSVYFSSKMLKFNAPVKKTESLR